MELILKTIDDKPVRLKLIEFRDSLNGDYFQITKIESLPELPEWLTKQVMFDISNFIQFNYNESTKEERIKEAANRLKDIVNRNNWIVGINRCTQVIKDYFIH
jgi:hypothetical protein